MIGVKPRIPKSREQEHKEKLATLQSALKDYNDFLEKEKRVSYKEVFAVNPKPGEKK